jgi:hypothetical protein
MNTATVRQSSSAAQPGLRRVLWRMQGTRRTISAALYRHPSGSHELVVAFEDNPNDIIETQRASSVEALVQRAEALKRVLVNKGLKPIAVP